MTRPSSVRRAGVTLLEALVAMLLLSVALLAWVRLESGLLHSERSTRTRRQLAGWMRNELRLQRNVRGASCLTDAPGPGWRCVVRRSCVQPGSTLGDGPGGDGGCALESVVVILEPPDGALLRGETAVWWPLQRAAGDGR